MSILQIKRFYSLNYKLLIIDTFKYYFNLSTGRKYSIRWKTILPSFSLSMKNNNRSLEILTSSIKAK